MKTTDIRNYVNGVWPALLVVYLGVFVPALMLCWFPQWIFNKIQKKPDKHEVMRAFLGGICAGTILLCVPSAPWMLWAAGALLVLNLIAWKFGEKLIKYFKS